MKDIIVKTFDELTKEEVYEILKVRFTVFIMEQRCYYHDIDDIDYRSIHLMVKDGKEVTTYARLFKEEEPGVWHVGRVLTLNRKEGMGARLMERVKEVAIEHGATTLRLEGQVRVRGFYEKAGFKVCSDEFDIAGIPHMRFECQLLS